MSIVVDLERLGETLAGYPFGYLLTTSGEAVKAVTISAQVVDGQVDIPVGSGGSADNLAANPKATLLFPPTEPRGYSLIVDGTASATDRGFRLSPATAVLHRPADHAHTAQGTRERQTQPAHTHDSHCGHDCRPV